MNATQQKKSVCSIDVLITEMRRIAERKVKNYFDDFTEYDVPALQKMVREKNKLHRLFWITRDCGTNMGYLNMLCEKGTTYSVYKYYMDDKANDFFEIDVENGKIKKIPFAKRSEYLREQCIRYAERVE